MWEVSGGVDRGFSETWSGCRISGLLSRACIIHTVASCSTNVEGRRVCLGCYSLVYRRRYWRSGRRREMNKVSIYRKNHTHDCKNEWYVHECNVSKI